MNSASSTQPMWGTLGTRGLDETPLCLHCLAPLRPDAHFCKRCMAPVSSYAAWGYMGDGNYESIWSTAWILHRAMVTRAPTMLHLIVILLVFAPNVLGGLLMLLSVGFPTGPHAVGIALSWLLVTVPMLYISVMFIWRTWRNFRAVGIRSET